MSTPTDQPNSLFNIITSDIDAVDRVIRHELKSDVDIINQVGDYIHLAGGKRIRPALVLLFAKALGYEGDLHHSLAAVIELLHTATLLHDDVVDESTQRRGRPSSNVLFGNAPAILVGDFIYTRAFQMMVAANNMPVMALLADATNMMARGEAMQLTQIANIHIDEEDYAQIIYAKTAKLFEVSAEIGAEIANAPPEMKQAAKDYGRAIGIAFQLIDDMLDYTGKLASMGKSQGDDLREGKMTLPLIYLMQYGSDADKAYIKRCIVDKDDAAFDAVFQAVQSSNALAYTQDKADKMANAAETALAHMPESDYKTALIALSQFAVRREH